MRAEANITNFHTALIRRNGRPKSFPCTTNCLSAIHCAIQSSISEARAVGHVIVRYVRERVRLETSIVDLNRPKTAPGHRLSAVLQRVAPDCRCGYVSFARPGSHRRRAARFYLGQTIGGPVIFGLVLGKETVKISLGIVAPLGQPDFLEVRPTSGPHRLRRLLKIIRDLSEAGSAD